MSRSIKARAKRWKAIKAAVDIPMLLDHYQTGLVSKVTGSYYQQPIRDPEALKQMFDNVQTKEMMRGWFSRSLAEIRKVSLLDHRGKRNSYRDHLTAKCLGGIVQSKALPKLRELTEAMCEKLRNGTAPEARTNIPDTAKKYCKVAQDWID